MKGDGVTTRSVMDHADTPRELESRPSRQSPRVGSVKVEVVSELESESGYRARVVTEG